MTRDDSDRIDRLWLDGSGPFSVLPQHPRVLPRGGDRASPGCDLRQCPRASRPGDTNFGYEHGTPDWREVVERDDIDVIDITAPNALHQEIAEAAAAAGKHIFCEKPVGIEPAATAAIELAARRAGVITGVGYNYRWAPVVQYTRQLIADGRFGDLTHYRGRFFSMYGRDRLGMLSWRFLQDEGGYGALSDIMSHAIDMAQYLCGPITRLVSVKEIFVKERPLPKPGTGTHYDRGAPGDPTGTVTNEDYVGALVRVRQRGARNARGRPFHLRPAEFDGLRNERLTGGGIVGPREAQPTAALLGRGAAQRRLCRVARRRHPAPPGQHRPRRRQLTRLRGHEGHRSLEFLKAVAEERPHHPGFGDALANASVAAAMVRSWESEAWEPVTSLKID